MTRPIVSMRVECLQKFPWNSVTSQEALWNTVTSCWDKMSHHVLNKLMDSIPAGMCAVINAQGEHTKYQDVVNTGQHGHFWQQTWQPPYLNASCDVTEFHGQFSKTQLFTQTVYIIICNGPSLVCSPEHWGSLWSVPTFLLIFSMGCRCRNSVRHRMAPHVYIFEEFDWTVRQLIYYRHP